MSLLPDTKKDFNSGLLNLVNLQKRSTPIVAELRASFAKVLELKTKGRRKWSSSAIDAILFTYQILLGHILELSCDIAIAQNHGKFPVPELSYELPVHPYFAFQNTFSQPCLWASLELLDIGLHHDVRRDEERKQKDLEKEKEDKYKVEPDVCHIPGIFGFIRKICLPKLIAVMANQQQTDADISFAQNLSLLIDEFNEPDGPLTTEEKKARLQAKEKLFSEDLARCLQEVCHIYQTVPFLSEETIEDLPWPMRRNVLWIWESTQVQFCSQQFDTAFKQWISLLQRKPGFDIQDFKQDSVHQLLFNFMLYILQRYGVLPSLSSSSCASIDKFGLHDIYAAYRNKLLGTLLVLRIKHWKSIQDDQKSEKSIDSTQQKQKRVEWLLWTLSQLYQTKFEFNKILKDHISPQSLGVFQKTAIWGAPAPPL
jgi:hypothetical protein